MFLSTIKNSLNLGNLTPAWHKCAVCEMVICFILLPDPQKWPFALVALVLCIIQLSVFNADDLETEQNIEYYFTFKTRSVGKESQCVSLSSKVGISPWKIGESSRTPSSQFNTAATFINKMKAVRYTIYLPFGLFSVTVTPTVFYSIYLYICCFHEVCCYARPLANKRQK